ncbi:MAG: alkaline phosphatase family protein [Alphaproteobacteria bacterium]
MSKTVENVLFITTDQWRGECLSVMGHPVVKTPHLDALAASGALFRHHYSQATPCGPARASLYTGLYQHNHRVVTNGTPLDERHANFALEARKGGHDPVLFGYTDIAADPRGRDPDDPELKKRAGLLPGLTPLVRMDNGYRPWMDALRRRGYPVDDEPQALFRPNREGIDPTRGLTFAPTWYRAEDSGAAFLTDQVLDYITARGERPWFSHISYHAPHPPYIAPEPYHALYDPGLVPLPVRRDSAAEEAGQHPWARFYLANQLDAAYTHGASLKDYLDIPQCEMRQIRATYYAMITEIDDQIGRLIAHLKETGVWQRTLIVFTSDHGDQLGDHWMMSKFSYYRQTYHIPLIIRDPRAASEPGRGAAIDAFTENVDLMPTILDCLGLGVPAACDGASLLPFCHGAKVPNWRGEAHASIDFRYFPGLDGGQTLGLAPDQCNANLLWDRRYKYVHFAGLPPLFFDLESDPHEFHNLADDPAHHGLVLEYAQKMLSWRMNHEERTLANTRLGPEGMVEHRPPRW